MSTARSTHTVIITIETYTMDRWNSTQWILPLKMIVDEKHSLKCSMLQFGESDLGGGMLVYEGIIR